jgi:outer membrane protein assembly factor BamE (lipoprotein component of BamABCDE complex)
MVDVRGCQRRVVAAIFGVLLVTAAGCGMFSTSKTLAEGPPTAPSVPPPVSLREAGAQVADEASLKQLVPGKTTKADVRERFGIPQEVILGPDVETYLYYRERTTGWFRRTAERVESLTIRFDSKGLLKDFEYRFAGK